MQEWTMSNVTNYFYLYHITFRFGNDIFIFFAMLLYLREVLHCKSTLHDSFIPFTYFNNVGERLCYANSILRILSAPNRPNKHS